MRAYKALEVKIAEIKEDKKEKDEQQANVKKLIASEVVNMGVGKGSKLKVEGVGSFNFTTQRYYRVPSGDERERLVRMIMDEPNGIALLTIGKKDLNDWCQDRLNREEEVPEFLQYFEDTMVPVISLKKAPKAQG